MRTDSPPRTQLLQVLSSPHSGSTILGVILGSSPEIFYGGEMDRIPVPIWRPGLVCSCGQPTSNCPFWGLVRSRYEATHDSVALEAGQKRFETWSSVVRTWAAALFGQRALRAHARETAALLRQVSETAGKPWVVDSSKFAGRALVYGAGRSAGLDVRYLHLIRDGRAVLASRKTKWSQQGVDTESVQFATRSALQWLGANLTFSLLFSWRRGRYLRLRHEDFVRDPEAALRKLERFLGVSLSVPLAKLAEGSAFPIVHVPAGNRFRLSGEVRFRRSASGGAETVRGAQRRAFWRVAGGLSRLYGYPKKPAPAESPSPAATPPA